MSRGRPDHGRRNQPFSASLRNRWWSDMALRKQRKERCVGERAEALAGTGGRREKPGNKAPENHAGA